LALFDALRRGRTMLRHQVAERVLVLAVSSADGPTRSLATRAGCKLLPVDAAIAICLENSPDGCELEIVDVCNDVDQQSSGHHVYHAGWKDEVCEANIDTPATRCEAFGASGAILLLSACSVHKRSPNRSTPFTIQASENGRSAAAILRFLR
jgi:hypothetical protein